MSPRRHAFAALALCVSSVQGCTTLNLGEHCKGPGFANVDSSSLGAVLGAPANRFSEQLPLVMFYSPSQAEPQAVLQLNLTPSALTWPPDIDESPCKGLDWRTFRVQIEPDQWTRFWALPRPMQVEGGIAFIDSIAPLPMAEFGIAIVDAATGKSLMSCGCYWT